MRSYYIRVGPDVLKRRGKFEHRDRGRDWNYATISQGTARIASNHQKIEEAEKHSPQEP